MKQRNLENELDDRWRRKGGMHKQQIDMPSVCKTCRGRGDIFVNGDLIVCPVCEGLGEVYG